MAEVVVLIFRARIAGSAELMQDRVCRTRDSISGFRESQMVAQAKIVPSSQRLDGATTCAIQLTLILVDLS
jgi:hypothetical protein